MKFNNIQKGEKLSTTMYMEVLDKTREGIKVKDSQGRTFEVKGKELIEKAFRSANQVIDTKKITKTELAERLTNLGDQVFTVNFDKQTGENRTLIGYKVSTENLMGRINVVDLEVTSGHNQRQVDLRTTKYAIIDGIKYQVK